MDKQSVQTAPGAEAQEFDGWSSHAEVGGFEHGHAGEGGGKHGSGGEG